MTNIPVCIIHCILYGIDCIILYTHSGIFSHKEERNFIYIYTHTQYIYIFWGAPKSLQMVTAAMKLKDAYSLEEKS